jgi:hypothetical protein
MADIINLHEMRRRDEEFVICLATILALEFDNDHPTAHEVECFLDDIDDLIAGARDDIVCHYQLGVQTFGGHDEALARSRAWLDRLEQELAITIPRRARA